MRVVLTNREILFEVPTGIGDLIDQRTTFTVDGYIWDWQYKAGRWDGREHLVQRQGRAKDGVATYIAPVGLMDEILKVAHARDEAVEVQDLRRRPGAPVVHSTWNPTYALRPYQQEAVDAVLEDRGLWSGKVLVDMATRAGKTVVAAAIIHKLKLRTLFIVPSEMLQRQTIESFRKILGIRPGKIGGGIWDIGPVTVASVQTLTRRLGTPEFDELMSSVDLVFFDEVHHVKSDNWREVLGKCDAFYKVGLSATIFLHKKKAVPKGTIWIRGAIGPVVYTVTPDDLIRQGYLVRPSIEMHKISGTYVDVEDDTDWREVYDKGIVEFEPRNRKIVELVQLRLSQGLSVVVMVKEVSHMEILKGMLEEVGVSVRILVGTTSVKDRKRYVADFESGRVKVLLGTIFGEGVDLPAIEAVIRAEGGKSAVAGIQAFRNITPAEGKTTAILDDFMDFQHSLLSRHSKARLKLYRSHPEFGVTVEGEVAREGR